LGVLLLAPRLAAAATSDDTAWSQFRGPLRDGTTSPAGLAAAWPASGPVERWRRPIGSGFSSVVVAGGRAYTMDAGKGEEAVLAFDAASGEPAWRTVVGVPMASEFGDGPRSTPAVVAGTLYAISSQSRLLALDAASGKLIWDRDLTQFEPMPRFGYAMSPLVVDGLVIVEVGTKDLVDKAKAELAAKADPAAAAPTGTEPAVDPSADPNAPAPPPPPPPFPPPIGAVAAFDAASGELRWRGGFGGGASYASPVLAELAGVRQLVYSRGTRVAGLGLDGKLLWQHETIPRSAIAMPLVLPGDVVFVSASDDAFGGLAIAVSRDAAGQWQTREVWAERLMRNHFNSSVRVGDALYGFDNGTFRCLDSKTGARRWAQRGFGKGSLVAAGDLLYVLGDDGGLALVRATPEAFREAGRVQALSGKTWTSPSLANGMLYLRDHQQIVAYDVREATLAAATPALPGPAVAAATAPPAATVPTAGDGLAVADILAKYAEAHGGAERWRGVKSLELAGTYRAFSERSPFTLARLRGASADLFRLDYTVFGGAAVRANDEAGPWLQHPFLSPEPLRLADDPEMAGYRPQMLREAFFAPLLLDAERLGLVITRAGSGEINGVATLDLKVTFPLVAGQEKAVEEVWHLDPQTFREVAVDSQVLDYTQGGEPFTQRAYYGDFRSVDGLAIPHRLDLEFNARYEGMEVATVTVNPDLAPARFAPPPKPPAGPAGENGAAAPP
jgi:outer membrane protein assembly factor BamB